MLEAARRNVPGRRVRPHEHQQGLRRPAQHDCRSWSCRRGGNTRTRRIGDGIPETFSIDQSKHSLFGASKVAADVMVQEYGRYFDMKTCCLRGGCLTGPNHSGVELHGFLSYLVKCNIEGRTYRIYGYKGKQVRDNIHSLRRRAIHRAFWQQPRIGEVYNIGGGRGRTAARCSKRSIASAALTGRPSSTSTSIRTASGDHICYISDLAQDAGALSGVGHHAIARHHLRGDCRRASAAAGVCVKAVRPARRAGGFDQP